MVINKRTLIYTWLTILIIGFLAYHFFPGIFGIAYIISDISHYYDLAIIIFIIILCFRGLLLISPLPITLASTLFFPPLTALILNSLGILVSTIFIYKFSEYLGFDTYFMTRYGKQIDKLKKRLDKKEIPIIFTWSFLPFFPTDLIVYLSATLKISLWKCLIGVFAGTVLIDALFIYSLNFFLPVAIPTSTQTISTQATSTQTIYTQTTTTTLPAISKGLLSPISDARARVTKKPFGIKISPATSPVQPEKFSGYHTGTDFEILPGEENTVVKVSAVCSGPLFLKKYSTGYGGVAVQKCVIDKKAVTIIYGHLKLSSISANVGDQLKAGDSLGILGQGYSTETDGERKHLHLGIHLGASVNLLGYVPQQSSLSSWLNALDYLP